MEDTVSGMVRVGQQFLVPLDANRKASGWNFDRLDNPILCIGAYDTVRNRTHRVGVQIARGCRLWASRFPSPMQ